ncbi:MAG: DJ-1/PfpI family protein [Bacillota bacterium]
MKSAIMLFDGVEELDFAGPYEVLASVGEVFTVAARREVRGRHGLSITPDHTFADAPEADVLVIPGGPVTRENPASLEPAVEFARSRAPGARMTLTVCTGAFVAARAGLLEGRSCTTHYRRRHMLQAQFPDLHVRFARVVVDGKIISTAGVAAGIDGALYTVARLFDMETARKVAKGIEYPWHSTHVMHASSIADSHEEAAYR